ncbi:Palmitoyltransferase [Aphelenchoides fujianensis]|nr:Palmitoyltransferase [Aphelenchoides fujianensis]
MSPIAPANGHANGELRDRRDDSALAQEPSTSAVDPSSDEESTAQSNPPPSQRPFGVSEAPDWPSFLVENERDVGRPLLRRLFHWGPLLAMGITTTIGLTTTIEHLDHWPITQPLALLNLSVFLFFNYGVFYNLIRASYVGGGYVTRGWRPPNQADTRRLQYCATCEGFKAPRSHHCSKCGRCVMKMDHHCPWINNCVGHRNQVFFIRFLASAVAGCLHALMMLSVILYHTFSVLFAARHQRRDRLSPYMIRSATEFIFVLLSVSFAIGVVIAVGVLLYTQVMIAARKRTTESGSNGEEFVFPYDLGWRRNLREVFPKWTTSFAKGNGIWWPEEQIIQKTNKRYSARVFDIVQSNPGGMLGARKAGLKALVCQPCSDEARIPVRAGESYAVTRANKRWFYGQRLMRPTHEDEQEVANNADEIHGPFSANPYADRANRDQRSLKQALEPRGWFPRAFAVPRPRPRPNESQEHSS